MRPDDAPTSDPEFLHTDARQRRNLALLLAGVIVFAMVFIFLILPTLTTWVTTGYTATALRKFAVVCYAIAALILIVAACVADQARRVFRSDQFPLPGAWVFKDTRVLRGETARMCAWGMVGVAACCTLLAGYVIVLPHLLHERLLPKEPAGVVIMQVKP